MPFSWSGELVSLWLLWRYTAIRMIFTNIGQACFAMGIGPCVHRFHFRLLGIAGFLVGYTALYGMFSRLFAFLFISVTIHQWDVQHTVRISSFLSAYRFSSRLICHEQSIYVLAIGGCVVGTGEILCNLQRCPSVSTQCQRV